MSRDEYPHPDEQREALLTAALRVALVERTWGTGAVPEDSEYDAREAFALAARVYVRAIDQMPERERPAGWDLNDVEDLRAQVAQLTEERDWLRATVNRNTRVIEVFVDHHRHHPLPEDIRKKVVYAMDGHGAAEYPGHAGSRWRDTDGDVWIHSDDGRMRMSHHPTDPETLATNLGPMTRVGGES